MDKSTWAIVGLVLVCVFLEIVGEITLKWWTIDATWYYMLFGILSYLCIAVVYGFALKQGSLVVANGLWQIFALIIISVIGVIMFKESLTVGQWFGLTVALIGMIVFFTGLPELADKTSTGWFASWPLRKE